MTIDFAIRTKHNKVRASPRGHIATCLKPPLPPMAIHSLTVRILSSPFPFVGRSNKAVPPCSPFLPAHKVAESKNEIESVIIGKAEMAQASFVAHDNILGHKDRRSSAHRHILVFAIRRPRPPKLRAFLSACALRSSDSLQTTDLVLPRLPSHKNGHNCV